MVNQLNNANRQPQASEAATGLRRLEALLSIGQSRSGQVVQVTPQPLPANTSGQGTAQQSPAPTTSQTAAQAQSQAQPQPAAQTPPPANPSTTSGGSPTNVAQNAAPTTGNTTAAGAQNSYLIQVRIEGRLYELLTQRPIDPGTRVQVSRDAGGQISLQLSPGANPGSSTAGATQTGGTPLAAPAQAQGQRQVPVQNNPQAPSSNSTQTARPATEPAAPRQAAAAAGRGTIAAAPSSTASTQPAAATQTPAPTAAGQAVATPNQSTTQGSAPAASRPDSGSATLERVPLQLQRGQLPAGTRLQVEVISSRPLPQTTVQQAPVPQTSQPQPTTGSSPAARSANLSSGPNPPVSSNTATPSAPESHLLRARVEGRAVELVSPRAIEPGTRLELRQQADGRLSTELPNPRTRSVEQALREHLPQQQIPAPLLNLLSGAQANGQLQQAKPVLLDLIQILLGRSLPNPQQADAETVRQQVQNSGTLLENKLARGDTQNLGQDHKALLLKLSEQLNQGGSQRELPGSLSDRLSQLTQQALSRVLVNQLTSAAPQVQEGGSEANRTLALDIPVLWQGKTENLQLQIRRDDGSVVETAQGMSYRWQVRLNFEINQTERLQAELTLEGQRISVIWSGDQQIRRLVEQQLDQLGERFERIGLDVKTLGVRDEKAQPAPTVKPPRSQLIDIKT
ncbi:flagellar hook-length control protein FliK [Motiliproteus sp.]|uniref:flagellar hook-length control protein FliK n=1 Tax=Motiliproteus sp. TaxID=1898955 RepID=UPI003BAC358A